MPPGDPQSKALAAKPVDAATLAADASALTFVTDIYNGYKGKDSPGRALDRRQRSGAISSRRWQP